LFHRIFGRRSRALALARAAELLRAQEIERLDAEPEAAGDDDARKRRQGHEQFEMLIAAGQRREAAELARSSADDALRARGRALEASRVDGAVLRVTLRGRRTTLVLGESVVIGRAPDLDGVEPGVGPIAVASVALSRRHVSVARRGDAIAVRDLGSRNGTTLGGTPLASEVRVGDGIELRLGGEVTLVVRRAEDLPGAAAIEIAGVRYVAPLGPATLGIGRWCLARPAFGAETWIELATGNAPPAFASGLRLAERVTVLRGDAFAAERGGEVALTFDPGGD
jgi:hypothetical protein